MIVRPMAMEDLPDKKAEPEAAKRGSVTLPVSDGEKSKREAFASRLMDKFFKEPDAPTATSLSAPGSPVLPAKPSTITITKPSSEKEDLQKKKEEATKKLRLREEMKKASLERRSSTTDLESLKKKKEAPIPVPAKPEKEEEEEDEEDEEAADESSSSEEDEKGKETKKRKTGKGELAVLAEFMKQQSAEIQQREAKLKEEIRRQYEPDTSSLSQALVFVLIFALIRLSEFTVLPFYNLDPETLQHTRDTLFSLGNDTLATAVILVILAQLVVSPSSSSSSFIARFSWKALSSSVLMITYGVALLGRFVLPPVFANAVVLLFWGTALVAVIGAGMSVFYVKKK